MAGVTVESGLSVSVESSPRTPSLVSGMNRSGSSGFYGGGGGGGSVPGAPLKKRIQNPRLREISSLMLGRELTEREEEEWADIEARNVAEEESISPRILFQSSHSIRRQEVARRLDFYSSGEWSPIPLATLSSSSASASASASASVAAASVASWEDATPIAVRSKEPEEESVGDCGVCYLPLPKRSNHVFTACGHLFCVKCLLLWWDTSTTCPMCRAEILEVDDAVAGEAAGTVSAATMNIVRGWEIEASESDSDSESESDSEEVPLAIALARVANDDSIREREVVEPPRPITTIDQYLHIDADVNWASIIEGTTNPEHDDWGVVLTRHECVNIRWGRQTASMLWARRRFNETLFSNIMFLGETFHTFIPKTNWLWFGLDDMGPQRMFEFVMCRTNAHTRGHETNFFGYISQVVIVPADRPVATTTSYDEYVDWENTNEYAFLVSVFNPTTAPYDMYNIDDDTYGMTELLFRFADIRRMYSIRSREIDV